MKVWIIAAIVIFILGVIINTIKDMLRTTDNYAKHRKEELARLEKEYQEKEAAQHSRDNDDKSA